ncbi:hypothetical protein [Morganella morganii]|uniref:Ankyrin repeat domain-containing protein n=1 Tax=Morganella morganii TaxID=582 RepID=A0AAU8ZR06_MORMO|nr:hypothetical protein [Morganella morganii]AVK37893.1 hypothetical protein CSB69_2836 [Morganella morganii]AWC95407.1 hypothetical protein AM380_18065 [Morganella morganii]ELO7536201.1 hypothetical protein [Morganella morganii]EMP53116.1 hypothetical protein C790_03092 [Morganella morganii SC01]MBM7212411.1 hypothetical protein [Morganella morganii]
MKYILVFLFFVSGSALAKCDKNNFDQCKTCDQLSKAVDLSEPDRGDYYRGALWNGLYASYVRNCPAVAEKLLEHGATPSLGGANAALPVVVSGKWPHDNKKINEDWLALLIKYKVNINHIPNERRSSYEIYLNNKELIEYPDIWQKFMDYSHPAPIDMARNIEWCSDKERMPILFKVLDICTLNEIHELDDNISPASDIADAVMESCKEDLKYVSDAFLCQALEADKKISDNEKIEWFKEMETKAYNDIYSKRRKIIMKKILEIRSNNRN